MLFQANLYLVFFSAALVFYFGLVEIAKKKHKNYSLLVLTLLIGTVQLRYGFYLQGLVEEFPRLFFWHSSIVMVIGPLTLWLGFAMIESALKKNMNLLLHLVPALVFALVEAWFFSQPAETVKQNINIILHDTGWHWLKLGIIVASLHISLYSFYLLYLFIRINRQYELYQVKLVWVILISPLFANLFIGLGFFLQNSLYFHLGTFFIAIVCLSFFFVTARYPGFFNSLVSEIKSQRYKNTPLDHIDGEMIRQRLVELMENERLYRDSELRVSDLASELNLSSHQLSRILNEKYEKNFNEFINGYRVAEARKYLRDRPDESILDIAYMVGFNSKSTFNAQFQKIVKQSPMQYRAGGS